MEQASLQTGKAGWRRARRWLARGLVASLAPPLLYTLPALVLGAIPTGSATSPGQGKVLVYLWANGVHVDFVVPIANEIHDWTAEFPLRDFPAGDWLKESSGREWIAFGWGDRRFFLETRTWGDLRVSVALQALFWLGKSALHVEYVHEPWGMEPAGRVWLTPEQYRGLVEYIRSSYQRDERGRPRLIRGASYFELDAFYEGMGRYSLIQTCNEWVGTGLRRCGARTGLWTPFGFSLLQHVERVEPPPWFTPEPAGAASEPDPLKR